MQHFFLAILFGLILAVPAAAQSGGEDIVAQIQDAYGEFDYDEADRLGREALRRYSDFTIDQLTDIHTILGLVAYNRGDLSEARRQFISALQLSPDLTLDPLLISPKIVEYFEEVRSDVAASDAPFEETPARYVVMQDRRIDGALRSMIVPGWGQFYKGHQVKGWAVASLFGATVAGAAGAHIKRQDALTAYENEENPELVESRYATANRWHKTRDGLIQGAAVVWLVGFVDALLTQSAVNGREGLVALNASPKSVSVALRF